MRQPTPHYASTGEMVTHKNNLAYDIVSLVFKVDVLFFFQVGSIGIDRGHVM